MAPNKNGNNGTTSPIGGQKSSDSKDVKKDNDNSDSGQQKSPHAKSRNPSASSVISKDKNNDVDKNT